MIQQCGWLRIRSADDKFAPKRTSLEFDEMGRKVWNGLYMPTSIQSFSRKVALVILASVSFNSLTICHFRNENEKKLVYFLGNVATLEAIDWGWLTLKKEQIRTSYCHPFGFFKVSMLTSDNHGTNCWTLWWLSFGLHFSAQNTTENSHKITRNSKIFFLKNENWIVFIQLFFLFKATYLLAHVTFWNFFWWLTHTSCF